MSSSAEQSTRSKGAEHTEKKLGVLEKALGVITALLAVVTAGLGVYAASTSKKADAATGQATTSQQQVQALQNQVTALQQQVAADQQTISSLQNGEGAPSDSAIATGDTTTPAAYHKDPVTVVAGTWGVDLDAPPDNHSWTLDGGTDFEFSYQGDDGVDIGTWSGGAVLMTGTPSYSACDHASGFSHDQISVTQLKRYPFLCFVTSDKRSSLVVIKSVTARQLKLDITTYATDGD